jgi:ABC-type phosphate transport system substrate-binding protein
MKTLASIIVAGLVVGMAACGNPSKQTGDAPETAISGTAEVLCDQEILGLMMQVKQHYDSANPKANLTLKPISAEDAVLQLFSHAARGIVIARDWSPAEAEDAKAEKGAEGYPRTMIARDALVFYTNKAFPYDTMSSQHLRAYIAGSPFPSSSYPKLKGAPVIVVPGSQSSVYGNIVNVVLKGGQPATDRLTTRGNADSVHASVLSHDMFVGVGYLSQLFKDTTVKMLRLSWSDSSGAHQYPRLIHVGNLVQDLYPFPAPIYLALRDPASQYSLPSGFMQYVARDPVAQRAFFNAGIQPAFATIQLNED